VFQWGNTSASDFVQGGNHNDSVFVQRGNLC
jgi:hypothetical protein